MFDRDLQKAAARYARAKTVEVYFNVAIAVLALCVIVAAGLNVIKTVVSTFGL